MRLRRNGNRAKPMHLYYSVKNGDHLPCEARTEVKACWWAEVSPDVVGYQTQPHTLRMVVSGKSGSYTPDLQLNLAGGGIQILEIKNRFDEAKDPAYSQKLRQAAMVYGALGYDFRVVETADLEQEPMFSAVATLQRYKTVAVDPQTADAVVELLAAGPKPLARVLERAPSGPRGLASIASMMVKRAVGVDLRHGLVADAAVALVKGNDVGAPLFAADR